MDKRDSIGHYFKTFPKWTIVMILLGLIVFFAGFAPGK